MKFISRHIFTGLITILPVLLTAYLLYWFTITTESLLGEIIRFVVSDDYYWPGMGLLVGIIAVFLIGLMMHAYIARYLFAKIESILYRMPLIKSMYRAIRDFFNYFSSSKENEFGQVVSVSFGDTGMQVIGFVTQRKAENLPEGFRSDDSVLVYIPLSYMIGGYTVLIPGKYITPLDMSMEEAMRFTLTAGVVR